MTVREKLQCAAYLYMKVPNSEHFTYLRIALYEFKLSLKQPTK